MFFQWMIHFCPTKQSALTFYSGRLTMFLWVKHLAKRKPCFFWCLWREHDLSPVTKFFGCGVYSFRCSKSFKIRTRSVLLLSKSSWRLIQPISILFERTNDGRMVHIEVFGQHFRCRLLPRLHVLFHGYCLGVKIWWSTSSFFICEAFIVQFKVLEPGFNLAFVECSIAKTFVDIMKYEGGPIST